MVVNKHGSFYLRNGWGTKIIQAVQDNPYIFSPSNEQLAVDNIGLGRVMVKALRYWSVAMELTTEEKAPEGIRQKKTALFEVIAQYDKYFEYNGSLLLLHRNLALNKENSTAWYWLFNEWEAPAIDKETFSNAFHSYLAVNGMNIKKDAVEKEFDCLKNTYISDGAFDLKSFMDEDTQGMFAPIHILKSSDKKIIEKVALKKYDVPVELLMYSIAEDNKFESETNRQISIDKLIEEKKQVGKYYNMKYSKLVETLVDAENKGYIRLNNNFGNRYIEFTDINCTELLEKYYLDKD